MAIVVTFDVPDMTAEQYEHVLRDLEDEGLASPEGRAFHVSAATDAGWFVCDVWQSQEHFDRFGEALMPLLRAAGVTPTAPVVRTAHKIIT